MREDLDARLITLKDAGLLREPAAVEDREGPWVVIGGRRLLNLSSNDYLGFASAPSELAPEIPSGNTASRLITGTTSAQRELELALAAYVGLEDARLFTSGYAANLGTIAALVGRADVIFSDRLNHASLIDGCRLSGAKIEIYEHNDLGSLKERLGAVRADHERALIVTDAVFSMDGDLADVVGLRKMADDHDAWLYVDEAHALGLFGPGGAGTCASAEVIPDVLLGTFGKSFGLGGAFVAGASQLGHFIDNRARSFVFSTAMLPVQVELIRRRLGEVRTADAKRARLAQVAQTLRSGLQAQGWNVPAGLTPIIPVITGDEASALDLAAKLRSSGVLAWPIRPPTVPPGASRLRLVPTAAMTNEHIEQALAVFAQLRDA